jgi:hypothetical protein
VILGLRRDADEICALLGYNAASSGNPLPTFRDNVSVPSSNVKKSKKSRKLARETRGVYRERRGRGQLTSARHFKIRFNTHNTNI